MYKHLFFSILFSLSISFGTAQKLKVTVNYTTTNGPADDNIIYYKTDQKLSWNDFKGEPVETGNIAAITSSGFGFNMDFRNAGGIATMIINVYCDFSKEKSWVKPARKTSYILNHEQHHFDVSYISARRFMQKLSETDFTTANYQSLIGEIYTDCSKEMEKLQNQYDNETQNGQVPDKQEAWNSKLDQQLTSMNTTKNSL